MEPLSGLFFVNMEKLILIHGALGNAMEFEDIKPLLVNKFEVITYEIPHHGLKKDADIPFSISSLTSDLLEFLSATGPAYIYGFSLGGYLAISAAQQDESNIIGIVTQGTKFDWSPEIAQNEISNLNIEFLRSKATPFYNYLVSLHGDYLPLLLEKTKEFMVSLGENPPISGSKQNFIKLPVRLTRGGKDRMVGQNETLHIHQSLANSYYFEIPFLPHPLGFIKPKHIARLIEVQLGSINYNWAKLNDQSMAYKVIGELEKNDTILLFLHEAIGSIAQWGTFPKELASRLDLPAIVIEFPGYGFSSVDEKIRDHHYLHEFALTVLPKFIANVCPNKKLVLIGHSDGGTNALLYASKHSEQVSKVVTMAAHFINEEETRAGIQPAIDAFEAGKLKGLELFHGRKTKHLFYNWARTWLTNEFTTWDISEDIEGLTSKTLVVQGTDDQYGTEEQVNGISKLLKNATPLMIEGCGHAPHLEKKEKVIEAIAKWNIN